MPVPYLPDEILTLIAESTEGKHVAKFRLVSRRFARVSHETFMDRCIRTRGIVCCWGKSLPNLLHLVTDEVLGRRLRHIIICPVLYTTRFPGYDSHQPFKLLMEIWKILASRKQDIHLSIVSEVNAAIPPMTTTSLYRELKIHEKNMEIDHFWHNALEMFRFCYMLESYPIKELSIDGGRNTRLANHFFTNEATAAVATNLRTLDFGFLYPLPRSELQVAELADMRHILMEVRCVEKLSLRLGWTWDFSDGPFPDGRGVKSHECALIEAMESLEALVGSITMPRLVSLELPKGLWYLRPLVDFIGRHSLTSLRLIDVTSDELRPSDGSLQQAFDLLKDAGVVLTDDVWVS